MANALTLKTRAYRARRRERRRRETRYRHVQERALERYGIELSYDDVIDLQTRIETYLARTEPLVFSDVVFLRHTAERFPRVSCYAVCYGDQWLPVAYSPTTRAVYTILPPEALPETYR